MTFAVTNGIAGLLALLLIPVWFIYRTYGEALKGNIFRESPTEESLPSSGFFTIALFVFASIFIYSSSLPFLLLGLAAASLFSNQSFPKIKLFYSTSILIRLPVVLLLISLSGYLTFISMNQFLAAFYNQYGNKLAQDGKPENAIPSLDLATELWESPRYLRDTSRAHLKAAFSAVSETRDLEVFKKEVGKSLDFAQRAIELNPKDHESWVWKASIGISMTSSGFPGFFEDSLSNINYAEVLSPTRPEIPYLRAVLLNANGDRVGAGREVGRSLRLKPDYQNALDLRKKVSPSSQ